MPDKLRVGIVGVGGMGIAKYHAREFLADERADLVACCDIQPEALAAFAAEHGTREQYSDYEAMLSEAGLDIVVICTNDVLHAEMTVQAAAHRPKAILCEKPMAMSLGEADAMLEACARNGVLLIIGHQRRYMPQYARAKELLQEGAIGELEQIQIAAHPGCSLLPDGTHCVDLIRFYVDDIPAEWLMGQIDARTKRVHWGHVLEDAAIVLIKFASGVRAWLTQGGYITPAGEPLGTPPFSPAQYVRIALHGSRGRIEVDGDQAVEGRPLLRVVRGGEVEVVPLEPGQWHRGLSPQVDLLNALEDGHRHLLAGESARADLELLMAVYESARLRRLVVLPLENRENPFMQMLAEGQ